ncbi:methionyl-tRNA formyltransferase [candidate division KSB1 bacterium]
MNLVFFGNTDFSEISLKKILQSCHNVICVVTNPDKKKGRGQKTYQTPVKIAALENKIPILTPDNLNDKDFINELKTVNADIFLVVAYRILPVEVFTLPPKGAINLHASYLPDYRGAAPINWVLINGEQETGLTTFALEKKVDTGNILLREKIRIDPEDDFGSLYKKLAQSGAELLVKTLDKLDNNEVKPIIQPQGDYKKAPKIHKENCLIDWNKSSNEIHNFIRGLSPYPAAYTFYKEKMIKIYRSQVVSSPEAGAGEIAAADKKDGIIVKCGSGELKIIDLQAEGKKRLKYIDFLNGFKLTAGEKFGN